VQRVDGIGGMFFRVATPEAAGIVETVAPVEYPNGILGRLHEPEENPVELWEPRGRDQRPSRPPRP
jgi:hypothetical protein